MKTAIQAFTTGLVDYAGLFPPAKLSMQDTVANFAKYRDGEYAWMLGRVIVPLARLEEFDELASAIGGKWSLSVIGQSTLTEDLEQIIAFNSRRNDDHDMMIESLERRFTGDESIPSVRPVEIENLEIYCEIPATDVDATAAVAKTQLMAKVRCGGLDRDAFPSDEALAGFVCRCHELRLPFKATAGLHHPIKSTRPATRAPEADVVEMHGFLNLVTATSLLHAGVIQPNQVADILGATDRSAFEISDSSITWMHHRVDAAQIETARSNGLRSFGSCSFAEPVEDLQELELLAR